MKRRRALPLISALGIIVGTLALAAPAQGVAVSCSAGSSAQLNTCIANANAGTNQQIIITIDNDFTADQHMTALNLPSTSTMIIDGNLKTITLGSFRGFDITVATGQTITINNLITTGGSSPDEGGAIRVRQGRLAASGLRIQNATAQTYGGGIALNDTDVTHTISRSVISGNTATTQFGGGIFAVGAVTLINSTVSGNTAAAAGGLLISGGSIGGVSSIQFSTVSGNSASADASNVSSYNASTQLRLIGTVVSNPLGTSGRNCSSAVLSASYAVIGNTAGDDTSCGAATSGGISLATTSAIALGTFSGTSLTPASSSVLVNGAPDALGTGITSDQTGTTRSGAFTIGSIQVAQPAVSISPASGSFGTVSPGTTSAPTTFTVTNSGSSTLTFGAGAATLSGANASDFTTATDTCSSASVAIGSTCSVSVTFTPGANGARTASLALANDAVNSPQSIALSGTGGSSGGGGSGGGGSAEPTPTTTPTPTATPVPSPTPAATTPARVARTLTAEVRFQRGTARLTKVSQGRITALAASVPRSAVSAVVRVVAVASTTLPTADQEALTRRRAASVTAALRAAGLEGSYDTVTRLPRGVYADLADRASATVVFTS